MKRINLSQLMARAWRIYRKTQGVTFGEALHRSWLAAKAEPINAQRIETARQRRGSRRRSRPGPDGKRPALRSSTAVRPFSGCL